MSNSVKVDRQATVAIQGETVMLGISCGDLYEARVLYEDLAERLQAGEGVCFAIMPTARRPAPRPKRGPV